MKKALSFILAFTLVFSVVAFSRVLNVSAALDDGKKLSVKADLEIGTKSGDTFTPIAKGQTYKAGDIITVRIIPKSDFLCGSTSYVAMFDKSYFSIVGTNTKAFTVNKTNNYYAQSGVGFSGSTIVPSTAFAWSLFEPSENHTVYQAVKASVQANSNSANGGHPEFLSGEWLFQFDLTVLKAIGKDANARIWMDARWFRVPGNTTVDGYFAKCEKESDLSSSGSSTTYDFKYDFSGADKKLPLADEQPTTVPVTNPDTTLPTKPGETTTEKPSENTTTKPGTTATTKPTTTRTELVTDDKGSTVAITDEAGSTAYKTTVVYETVARTEIVTDKDGSKVTEKDAAGSTVYKTTVVYEKVVGTEYVTGEDGSKVFVTDEAGSTVYETTLIYETVDEDGNVIDKPDAEKKNVTTKKAIIIVVIIAALFGVAVLVIKIFGKKK